MLSVIGLVVLTVFGVLFAVWVYRYPVRPTWLSVAIGVGGTLFGASLVIIDQACDNWAIPIVALWGSFVVTGLPMIIGQIAKDKEQRQEARRAARDTGPLDKGP